MDWIEEVYEEKVASEHLYADNNMRISQISKNDFWYKFIKVLQEECERVNARFGNLIGQVTIDEDLPNSEVTIVQNHQPFHRITIRWDRDNYYIAIVNIITREDRPGARNTEKVDLWPATPKEPSPYGFVLEENFDQIESPEELAENYLKIIVVATLNVLKTQPYLKAD